MCVQTIYCPHERTETAPSPPSPKMRATFVISNQMRIFALHCQRSYTCSFGAPHILFVARRCRYTIYRRVYSRTGRAVTPRLSVFQHMKTLYALYDDTPLGAQHTCPISLKRQLSGLQQLYIHILQRYGCPFVYVFERFVCVCVNERVWARSMSLRDLYIFFCLDRKTHTAEIFPRRARSAT